MNQCGESCILSTWKMKTLKISQGWIDFLWFFPLTQDALCIVKLYFGTQIPIGFPSERARVRQGGGHRLLIWTLLAPEGSVQLMSPAIVLVGLWNPIMWVKQYHKHHKPPMAGNGKHTIYGDLGTGLFLFYPHWWSIIYHYNPHVWVESLVEKSVIINRLGCSAQIYSDWGKPLTGSIR